MSTSEIDELEIGSCPCGLGKIIHRIVSQSNPWSTTDRSYRLNCPVCVLEWELSKDGEQLTKRSSLAPYRTAAAIHEGAGAAVWRKSSELAARYMSGRSFPTRKAEHEWLLGKGAYRGSYRNYLADRKTKLLHELLVLDPRGAFLAEIIADAGAEVEFAALLEAKTVAVSAMQAAKLQVVRFNVRSG